MSDQDSIDPGLVRELAEILDGNDLAEIEIKTGDMKLRLSKAAAFAMPTVAAAPAPAQVVMAPEASGSSAAAPAAGSSSHATASVAPARAGDVVPSPMVGTAYLAPSPGAEDFIKVGQQVREGDTLLIIEAMKVMNQIPAPRSGKVVEIMCENGQPVEFDQPLLVIE